MVFGVRQPVNSAVLGRSLSHTGLRPSGWLGPLWSVAPAVGQPASSIVLFMLRLLPGWTTPQHRDHKGIDQKACKGEINNSLPNQVAGLTASPSPAGTESRAGSVLNPAMSRWLMGFPQNGATPGWDTCSPGWQNWALIQMLLGEYYETQRGTASAPCEAQATL